MVRPLVFLLGLVGLVPALILLVRTRSVLSFRLTGSADPTGISDLEVLFWRAGAALLALVSLLIVAAGFGLVG